MFLKIGWVGSVVGVGSILLLEGDPEIRGGQDMRATSSIIAKLRINQADNIYMWANREGK